MINFKQFFEGLRIKAKSVLTSDTKGELEVDSVSNKINYHDGSVRSPLVTEVGTATLTNKSISGLNNTITNVTATTNANLTGVVTSVGNATSLGSFTSANLLTALTDETGSGVAVFSTSPTLVSPNLGTPSAVVLTNATGTAAGLTAGTVTTNANLTGPVTSVGNATSIGTGAITSTMILDGTILDADVNATAAIARTKFASGTANKLIVNNGSGVMSEMSGALDSTNAITLDNTKHIELQAQTDAATTGANASLAAFTAGGVRVTNASLTSLANIPAGANGQEFVLFNRTGVAVIINDSFGALGTAANRILTGTSADITMAINSALSLRYDSATSRWQVVGGSGSGSGGTAITSDRYEVDSTASQTVINFPFSIAQNSTEKKALQLYVDGIMLREGASYDFTYTSVSGGFSSQVTLNSPLAAGISIMALKVGGYTNTSSTVVATTVPNYITNIGAETDTTGFATYLNTVQAAPVTGAGGTSTITYTRSTVSPLRGVASFLLTKTGAVSRQGNGFSYDFSIDASDKGKVLQGNFEYQIASGTYADNDLAVWIYDVTNAVLIQPAPYLIKNSGIIEKIPFEFQTAINSTSYRLIVHVASTSALDYSVKFDNFNVGPQAKLYGSAVTDWVSYTPTYSAGFGTVSTSSLYWKRSGDSVEIKGTFLTGTVAASSATISMPSGLVSDTSKMSSSNLVGFGGRFTLGVPNTLSVIMTSGANVFGFSRYADTGTNGLNGPQTGTAIFGSAEIESFYAKIPVAGWSSSQIMSSDASTTVVAMGAYKSVAQTLATNTSTTVTGYDVANIDDVGAFNPTTGVYTVKVAGKYRVSATTCFATNSTGYRFNGVVQGGSQSILQYGTFANAINGDSTLTTATAIFNAKVGDTFYQQAYHNSGANLDIRALGGSTSFYVDRLSGPSQIAASESVSALYTGAPPTSATLTPTPTTTTFGTKVKDTHNAYSGGVYTVPVSGTYDVSAQALIQGTFVGSNGSDGVIAIFVDGVQKYIGVFYGTTGQAGLFPAVNVKSIPLLAGQLVTIRCAVDSVTSPVFNAGVTANFFSISRSGNY